MQTDYPLLSRVFHHLALGSDAVASNLHRMECRRTPVNYRQAGEGRHVFVTGLARAGTTILMRTLYDTGVFASLTYRDMPMVMAPNFWAGLQENQIPAKGDDMQERAHGDRILVGKDSPEALDEVFWRVYNGQEYIRRDHLLPHDVPPALGQAFQRYVGLILHRTPTDRYLSKNNNNLMRLDALRSLFPQSIILIPFRNPVDHATSLLNQHRRFCDIHRHNRFSRAYMRWLVHHEFGLDHRPMVFEENWPSGNPMALDYWLEVWRLTYRFVIRHRPAGTLLIGFEDLCDSSGGLWNALAERLKLSTEDPPGFNPPPSGNLEDAPLAVVELYDQLRMASRQDFSL